MEQDLVLASVRASMVFTFSRSGGNGGQNVNKVNTKAHGTLNPASIRGLTPQELELVLRRLSSRINAAGQICVCVDEERTQEANRRIAIQRVQGWVVRAAQVPKKRKKTRVPRQQKELRLQAKKVRSRVKELRRMDSE